MMSTMTISRNAAMGLQQQRSARPLRACRAVRVAVTRRGAQRVVAFKDEEQRDNGNVQVGQHSRLCA